MRVLFTTPILEHPAVGGPQLRIENSIKALSAVCELDIINRSSGAPDDIKRTGDYFESFCDEYHVLPVRNLNSRFSRYLSFPEKIINRLFDTRLRKHAQILLEHVDRRGIDVLWFGYGNISYPLMQLIKAKRPELKLVSDTDSVWSRFVLREAPYAKGVRKFRILQSGRRKEAEERAWVNLCDVTTAVSEVDAEYYRSVAADPGRVHVFSNVIDIKTYYTAPPPLENFKKPSIYLAGSFGHYNSPMDTAARWMLEEVFPKVLKKYPDLHFYIVGRDSELGFGQFNGPNVTVTGRLDSVLPYLCNVDVALVPLMFESGTRFKILEAGACKIPLVSTALGAEGIPVVDGQDILIADEPEEFADAIIKILDDKSLADRLAQNCFRLVTERYSVEALTAEAKHILEYLKHD
jgi:glycosyltransferase involved in cell wall biosynthesis